ncbi:serine/threonine protein kinase [Polytolypa hystricis UAMH7299]|uniref:Serine/threonine protein kinase n=1 Tax=Polytolypa hystricis (strain UAMH7299) TaxID=1447883 RepID=A0A2B7XH83_POLH7|nr:serine/threonine protein kinase [Polytolypa hystricis UAMH7299]
MPACDPFSLESLSSRRTLNSSIGGFSQPAAKQIRSLQELLKAIQPLHLELFEGSALQKDRFLGEGVSYKVFRCFGRRSRKVVALKQVKLPPPDSDFEAFQSRVSSVLKDIEVMHHAPLAAHRNILDILGYGWQLQQGSIPFLITECAEYGTLREYLRDNSFSIRQKQKLCRQVASGLLELHRSGIAHGDLKLDNVLVVKVVISPDNDGEDAQVTEAVLKIADFGHSLLLSPDQIEGCDLSQKYRGTVAYNAPELFSNGPIDWDTLDFRKCDLWAFGLLCLEVLRSGSRFFEDERIRDGFSSFTSSSSSFAKSGSSMSSTESHLQALPKLRESICGIAMLLVTDNPRSVARVSFLETFRQCLVFDPSQRLPDASRIPILEPGVYRDIPPETPQLNERLENQQPWSFANLQPEELSQIPHIAKAQMISDIQRVATRGGHSAAAARAALQLSYAYAIGYGVQKSNVSFLSWAQTSSERGLAITSTFLPLFKSCVAASHPTETVDHQCSYNLVVRSMLRNSENTADQQVDASNRRHSMLAAATSRNAVIAAVHNKLHTLHPSASGNSSTPSPNITDDSTAAIEPISVVFTKNLQRITSLLSEYHLDLGPDPVTGEPPLLNAARMGDTLATLALLHIGANPSVASKYGCTPLHWLFMFPEADQQTVGHELVAREESHGHGDNLLVHTLTTNVQSLDSQFPLELMGTPLCFAVATASLTTVKVLLKLGSSPLIGPVSNRKYGCPLSLAVSLHLYEIYVRFLPWVPEVSINRIDLLPSLTQSSSFERQLIHGPNAKSALETTCKGVLSLWDARLPELQAKQVPNALDAAICNADLDVADAIIDAFVAKFSPEQSDSGMSSILISLMHSAIAILHQNDEVLRFLLQLGAEIRSSSGPKWSVLHMLSIHGFLPSLSLSLLTTYDLDEPDSKGVTALHYVAKSGSHRDLSALLQLPINKSPLDFDGSTPLHYAINSRDQMAAYQLITAGCSLETQDMKGRTALYMATLLGLSETAKALLNAGSSPFLSSYADGMNSLHVAVDKNRLLIVRAIIKSLDGKPDDLQALISSTTSSSPPLTPLELGVSKLSESDSLDVCSALLAAGANPTRSLISAVRAGLAWLAKYLVSYKPNYSIRDRNHLDRGSPLTIATRRGDFYMLTIILASDADVNATDGLGKTCLHYAAEELRPDILDFILENNPTLNLPTPDGYTSLDLALQSSKEQPGPVAIEACFSLLKAGGSPKKLSLDTDLYFMLPYQRTFFRTFKRLEYYISGLLPWEKFTIHSDLKTTDSHNSFYPTREESNRLAAESQKSGDQAKDEVSDSKMSARELAVAYASLIGSSDDSTSFANNDLGSFAKGIFKAGITSPPTTIPSLAIPRGPLHIWASFPELASLRSTDPNYRAAVKSAICLILEDANCLAMTGGQDSALCNAVRENNPIVCESILEYYTYKSSVGHDAASLAWSDVKRAWLSLIALKRWDVVGVFLNINIPTMLDISHIAGYSNEVFQHALSSEGFWLLEHLIHDPLPTGSPSRPLSIASSTRSEINPKRLIPRFKTLLRGYSRSITEPNVSRLSISSPQRKSSTLILKSFVNLNPPAESPIRAMWFNQLLPLSFTQIQQYFNLPSDHFLSYLLISRGLAHKTRLILNSIQEKSMTLSTKSSLWPKQTRLRKFDTHIVGVVDLLRHTHAMRLDDDTAYELRRLRDQRDEDSAIDLQFHNSSTKGILALLGYTSLSLVFGEFLGSSGRYLVGVVDEICETLQSLAEFVLGEKSRMQFIIRAIDEIQMQGMISNLDPFLHEISWKEREESKIPREVRQEAVDKLYLTFLAIVAKRYSPDLRSHPQPPFPIGDMSYFPFRAKATDNYNSLNWAIYNGVGLTKGDIVSVLSMNGEYLLIKDTHSNVGFVPRDVLRLCKSKSPAQTMFAYRANVRHAHMADSFGEVDRLFLKANETVRVESPFEGTSWRIKKYNYSEKPPQDLRAVSGPLEFRVGVSPSSHLTLL